ncbi:MAG: exosortase [Emcibacteraceae bacterium]|nr:exosortase [Emcibacteraceae bacterium]
MLNQYGRWMTQEEYSHGFLIPAISLWMLYDRRDALAASIGKPMWSGLILILMSAFMLLIGELSAIFILVQTGFILSLLGISLVFGGMALLRLTTLPILFLLFAIPMPYFLDSIMSWRLQLISSELGVFFIRVFGIPVFLEGNVIDLGSYKLQVVDACSGLRYLYPLTSLGFLIAYLFKAPLWQRTIVFLSTIPITILMNSFRIGMVGVLVEYWGGGMADGLLHYFEGWVIFMACAAILCGEVWLFTKISAKGDFFDLFDLPEIAVPSKVQSLVGRNVLPLAISAGLIAVTMVVTFNITDRIEQTP